MSEPLTPRDEAHLRNCAGDDVWLAQVAIAEIDRLRLELEGEKKANALLYAGMESQAELMDGLKQETRILRTALSDRDRQLAELREACQPFAEFVITADQLVIEDDLRPLRDDDSMDEAQNFPPTIGACRRLAALLPPPAKEEPRAE